MEVPEIIPVPLMPEIQKNLIPAAVKRSEPPIFDPEREGGTDARRKKRRRGRGKAGSHEPDPRTPADEPDRGAQINIRA